MKKLLMMIGGAAVAVGAMLPIAAMADAVRVYDVDDYVQDGLVGHFDGIRNAGATEVHNPTATTWKNLVPGQPDATFNTANGNWTDDAFNFTGDVHATVESPGIYVEGSNLSIQIATVVDWMAQPFVAGGKYYAIFFGNNNNNDTDIFINNNSEVSSTLQFNADKLGTSKNDRPSLTSWDGQYATAILGDGISYLVQGTTLTGGKTRTNTTIPARNFTWGGQEGNSKYYSKGTFHSVRIYKKALTEEELVQNRVVDEARYRNEASKGKGNDDLNVIVASNVEGAEGTEESGKWYIAEGTHTFTASATTVVGAKFYTLDGYTVETWDGSAWGAAVTNSGASYTASSSAKVRLTWLWTLTLRGAAAYDVDDYVQDGLVAHFDGIRNAGADAAHASSGTTWVNLADGENNATINGSGSWTGDGLGYNFTAASDGDYAITDSGIGLGAYATIQISCDIDYRKQTSGSKCYPSVFNDADNDCAIFFRNTNTRSTGLEFNADDQYRTGAGESNRPKFAGWGGEYVTAVLGVGNAYLFEGTTLENEKARRSDDGSSYTNKLTWGGCPTSGYHFSVTGTYYSVRAYNRALSEAELAQNRRVDEIRFHGNGDVTVVNGTIGDTGANGESSLPDGVYNIETGTWTITAPEIKSGGRTYLPKLLVEQYNATTGEWVATTAKPQWAESYTVDKSALGGNRVRLTWTWKKHNGLIISFF